ncbi:hypothetical protein ACF1FX_23110 [Streptomyces sp. NPDC014646]|uniref:hypothetical protein n=1 Tax=Streptomyces sp. NPDC014646 TaxID=3364877 RepID=UPI0036FEE6FD
MSDPNPHADNSYQWGPPQQDGQGNGPAGAGAPAYGYPKPLPESAAQPGPAYGYPPGPAAQPMVPGHGHAQPGAPMAGAPLLALGDITIVNDQIITPVGTMPLKGAVWSATDLSHTEERIPTVAIVLAIVFALLCLVGLLFLLMKEKKTTGFIQVSVTSDGKHHSTMIPATGPETFPCVMSQLNSARAMSV